MASHLIFNKFLPRSLFGDLVSNRILTCIFSNENKHANHLDFNTFLAGIFLNTNIHASHLIFFLVVEWLPVMQTRCFVYRVHQRKLPAQSKVLCKRISFEKFHGWLERLLIKNISKHKPKPFFKKMLYHQYIFHFFEKSFSFQDQQ